MSDGVQPGTKVDRVLWERFRDEVERRKGGVRGHIRTELENALHAYIQGGDATPAEINARLQRIEAAVGAAGTDGGVDTLEEETHTHAPSRVEVDGKPPANAATEKKVAYLAQCIQDEHGGEFEEVPRSHLVDTVKEEYAFRSDTAKRYVERLISYFDLEGHPMAPGLLVTPSRYEELDEQKREQARLDAEQRVDELDDTEADP